MKEDYRGKVIFNSEAYPSNSHKSKEEVKKERTKRKKVATGRRPKRSFLQRFSNAFLDGEPAKDVVDYILYDVVVPAAKTTVADLVEGAIDMVLFGGERRSRHVIRDRTRSYHIPYNSMYNDDRNTRGGVRNGLDKRRPHDLESGRRNRGYDFDNEIVFDSRGEAESVLEEMSLALNDYDRVSIADLYDVVGLTSEYTDQKFGWFDLEGMYTCKVRGGWALKLPKPVVLE